MFDEQDTSAWSLYWSQDRLHSCVAQSGGEDQEALTELWSLFAATLKPNDKVLDLASGNGAVASALLSKQHTLKIHAVDKADIDPHGYLSNPSKLTSVSFHANTDILSMPFESSSFDAITSQFGIEYAGFCDASYRVMEYLRDGGCFQYIVHNANSDIMRSSKLKISELQQLTRPDGLLDTLLNVLRGDMEFDRLERLGKSYMDQERVLTEAISGQVFSGIEEIANRFAAKPKDSLELGVALNLRVRFELTRLRQLIDAGQTDDQMTTWSESFASKTGMRVKVKPIYVDPTKQEYLLGWLVSGNKAG